MMADWVKEQQEAKKKRKRTAKEDKHAVLYLEKLKWQQCERFLKTSDRH